MRITLDLPDQLLRRLKAKSALDGTTLEATIRALVERGLHAAAPASKAKQRRAAALPTIRLGHPLNLPNPSNAALFNLLDE